MRLTLFFRVGQTFSGRSDEKKDTRLVEMSEAAFRSDPVDPYLAPRIVKPGRFRLPSPAWEVRQSKARARLAVPKRFWLLAVLLFPVIGCAERGGLLDGGSSAAQVKVSLSHLQYENEQLKTEVAKLAMKTGRWKIGWSRSSFTTAI